MKISLIVTLVLSSIVWADRDRVFYKEAKGFYKTIPDSEFVYRDNPFPKDIRGYSIPVFTLERGIATTGEGDNKKYFGFENGKFILGSKEKVKPYILRLSRLSRVVNLGYRRSRNSKGKIFYEYFRGDEEEEESPLNCNVINIFLLSPIEILARKRTGSNVMRKRKDETDKLLELETGTDMELEAGIYMEIDTDTEITN